MSRKSDDPPLDSDNELPEADTPEDRLRNRFRNALDSHGYGFQYAVVHAIRSLNAEKQLGWEFVGTEFPVETRGKDGHIDIVLRHRHGIAFIVAECKRPDPAVAHWCFAKSSKYGSPNATAANPVIEYLINEANHHSDPIRLIAGTSSAGVGPYHVGIELRTAEKGEGRGGDRDAISQSVSQVLRGCSGLANLLKRNPRFLGDMARAAIFPVVFTTARLSTTDEELHTAELASGKMPELRDFTDRKWLWYQHNVTHSLMSDLRGRWVAEEQHNLQKMLLAAHVRAVAIVNAGGIEQFLLSILD